MISLLAFSLTFTFFSCSDLKEDIPPEIETPACYSVLQSNMKDINNTYESPQSRGFLSRLFKRVLNVFVSDCVGAIKGAFSGENIWQSAQGASLSSAKKQSFITGIDAINTVITRTATLQNDVTVTPLLQTKDVALNDLVLVDDPSSATLDDSIGYYHNAIILTTLENNNSLNYWESVSDYACVLELNKGIMNSVPASCYSDTILNQETINFCTFISDKSLECQDYKALLTESSSKYPELRNLLNTTNIFFEGMELVATDEEWHDYCKNILKVIENSDIPTSDKKALKMGITVGYASSKLWKPE